MYYGLTQPPKKIFQVLPSPKPQQNSSPSNPQTDEHSQLNLHNSSDPCSKQKFCLKGMPFGVSLDSVKSKEHAL